MFDKIIRFSIQNKLVIALATLALVAWGFYEVRRLPIDAVPDITNNQVQVITNAPSQSAGDIERLVTFPVEQSVANIPGITEVRSFSRFGLSVITIVFKDGIDVYWARQQVNERLAEAKTQIPDGVGSPELAPVTTGLGEIYQYVLRPEKGYENKFTAMDLRTIQDWIVRRQLLGTEGVAEISSFGGYLKQYEVTVNTDRLRSMNVSIGEVMKALRENNQNTGGAYIDTKPYAYFIRSEGLINTLTDIEAIPVKTGTNGIPVLIRDVATVQYGHAVRYGAMTRNAGGEVVGGIVMMLKGANAAAVIAEVKGRIARIEKSLPEGVTIEPFLDRTKLVKHSIGTVSKNLIEGALIVIFVLVLLLGNLRAGLIVASLIPLSMLFAIGMMNLFGVSGNLMSLGAIDFGLIVDGAVIIVEATMHHMSRIRGKSRLTQAEMDEEVLQSASRMRTAAAFGELIILIVYLPILSLQGIEGKMFKPMAQTVTFAILGAFILSLTYVPMMSALFLSKKTSHKPNISDRLVERIHRLYEPLLIRSLRVKTFVTGVAIAAFIGSLFLFRTLGAEFLPSLDEGDFAVETRVMTGSSLTETVEVAQKAATLLMKHFPDEVVEVVGKIGTSEVPTDPMPVEACDLMVILKDKKKWKKASDKDELADQMGKLLENIPGATFGFQQPIQMRFNELMTGARQDVVVKIYGEDLDVLSSYAKKVAAVARKIEGTADMYVEQATGLPQIVVDYNREQIARYGVSINDLNAAVNAAFAGQSVGQVYEAEKRFDLVVRLDTAAKVNISDVRSLNISLPNGQQIPLSQLATIDFKTGPNQIQRDDAKRRIIVGFNVRGRDVESIIEELQKKIDVEVRFAPGYSLTYGGTFENLQQARERLSIAVPIALLLIFLLLYATFRSVSQSLMIYAAIPLSAIGGVVALWLRGMPFSISAGVGFIALFGVAVLNGIVLIAEFNNRRKAGQTDLWQIVVHGAGTRLRPVMLTAMVASLGFLPMALSHGSGAEVQKPLATVVIGGLISATLLTLFVLPCLYLWIEGRRGKKQLSAIVPTVVLLVSGLLFSSKTEAQTEPSTLQDFIGLAKQNNLQSQAAAMEVSQARSLEGSAFNPDKTTLFLVQDPTTGGGNSNAIGVTQNIAWPGLYSAQRKLLRGQTEQAQAAQSVTEAEIRRLVSATYNDFLLAQAKQRLLAFQDSIYRNFTEKAGVRYRSGETSRLEQLTALNKYQEVQLALREAEADVQIASSKLRQLTGYTGPIEIQDTLSAMGFEGMAVPDNLDGNPSLNYWKQGVSLAEIRLQSERAKLLPDFSLSYLHQFLIKGYNPADINRIYFPNTRQAGFQIGVNVPLFFGATRARIQSEEIGVSLAQRRLAVNELAIQTQYREAYHQILKYRNTVDYFQKSGLTQTNEQIRIAQVAFQYGEIGYVEFVQNISLAVQSKLQYLNALSQYNAAIINLNFLKGQ